MATPAAPTAANKSGVAIGYNSSGTPIDLAPSVTGVHSMLTVVTAPAHGTTTVNGDVVTYTPTSGYFGADSFTYTVTGPGGTSAAATVSLTGGDSAAAECRAGGLHSRGQHHDGGDQCPDQPLRAGDGRL